MKMPSHIQPQNRKRIFRIYSKPKKSCCLHSFVYIVSAKLKNFFVALDVLQQSKSGPRPKRLGTTDLYAKNTILGHLVKGQLVNGRLIKGTVGQQTVHISSTNGWSCGLFIKRTVDQGSFRQRMVGQICL